MEKVSSFKAHCLFRLRKSYLFNRYANHLRRVRALITFGPWRHLLLMVYRFRYKSRVKKLSGNEQRVINASRDISSLLRDVKENGFVVLGKLRMHVLENLKKDVANLKPKEYAMTHQANRIISQLSQDPTVQNLLSEYFGYTPFIRESSLTVTRDSGDSIVEGQNGFHQDYAGAKSLNLFVYLTDVGESDPYHEVLLKSHRKAFRHAWYKYPLSEKLTKRFKKRFDSKRILGPAGTVFLENTEALHRRELALKRRIMLNILFSATPGIISEGRFANSQIIADKALLSRE